jgi:Holliday junction DNA helicase RuvB
MPGFTIIFATTDEYQIQAPLRNRMRIHCRFDYYLVEDLVEIVRQKIAELKVSYESEQVLQIIAQRAKRTPRLALDKNLATCLSVFRSNGHKMITLEDAHKAFGYLQIDELGLDRLDRLYLKLLYNGGPSTVGVLSSRLSMPSLTIQRVVEPYLLREGFIDKAKASVRTITQKGRDHIESTSFKSGGGGQ